MSLNNLILAGLATVMIIVLFATVVTITQQFVFKLLQSRRIGMIKLLNKMFDGAVAPRLQEAGLYDADTFGPKHARHFALDMTVSKAFPPRLRRISNAVILRRYLGSRLERMTTRQFVEHLANTDAGYRFAQMERAQLARTLKDLAYEFERYGEEQWRAFKVKTTTLTVVIGVIVAMVFNVDIWRTFNTLLADPVKAAQVVRLTEGAMSRAANLPSDASPGFIDVEPSEDEAAEDGTGSAPEEADSGVEPAPEEGLPDESEAPPETAIREVNAEETDAAPEDSAESTPTSLATDFGLPIGLSSFPYCVDPVRLPPPEPQETLTLQQFEALPLADARCGDGRSAASPLMWLSPAPGAQDGVQPLSPAMSFWERLTSSAGVGWLLSIVLAGALFGLGAPFWFDVFTRLASLATQRNLAQLTTRVPAADGGEKPVAIRPQNCVDEQQLVEAFETSARSSGVALRS